MKFLPFQLLVFSYFEVESSGYIPFIDTFLSIPSQITGYPLSSSPEDVAFYFYPLNGGPEQEIIYNDTSSLHSSGFNFSASKTILTVHGFTDDRFGYTSTIVRSGYLNSSLHYNIISVDWGKLSGSTPFNGDYPLQLSVYTKIVNSHITLVARRVSEFLIFLGVEPSTIHILGHSLGAHVSGNAGTDYHELTGKKIGRVTGLDPAGPLYYVPFPFDKIHHKDAQFVDVLGDVLGDVSIDGDVDFVPNGGTFQTGCDHIDIVCNHRFAAVLFAKSISTNFTACKCFSAASLGDVGSFLKVSAIRICDDDCPEPVNLGEFVPETARGVYALSTEDIF